LEVFFAKNGRSACTDERKAEQGHHLLCEAVSNRQGDKKHLDFSTIMTVRT